MTREEMLLILADVTFPGYTFTIGDKSGSLFLQGHYREADITTGAVEEQTTRKWYLSPHMTRSELVQTALKLALTSAEHRVREHFLYRGERIYGPHFDCEALWELARAGRFDVRKDP